MGAHAALAASPKTAILHSLPFAAGKLSSGSATPSEEEDPLQQEAAVQQQQQEEAPLFSLHHHQQQQDPKRRRLNGLAGNGHSNSCATSADHTVLGPVRSIGACACPLGAGLSVRACVAGVNPGCRV